MKARKGVRFGARKGANCGSGARRLWYEVEVGSGRIQTNLARVCVAFGSNVLSTAPNWLQISINPKQLDVPSHVIEGKKIMSLCSALLSKELVH